MSGVVRAHCGPSTADLGFFFDSAHTELAEQARHLAMRTFAPEEASHAGKVATHAEIEARCRSIATRLASARLLEAVMPTAHGGLGISRRGEIDVRAVCVVREMLAWGSPLAEFVFAMQGLGSYPIVRSGTEEQQREFLAPVRAGTSLAAFAITESEAGSDVAAMSTKARRDGAQYVIDGEKTFISNAGMAGHYIVFAKTSAEAGSKGISAFIVRPTDPGFEFVGAIPLIAEHPVGTIRFRSMRIPAARRLGNEGDGFRIAMATLDAFRSTVGAASLGMARRALDEALARANTRVQFGKTIGEFQTTQVYLAEMATELDAARLLVYRAAWLRDHGAERVTLEASMAKMFATESAQRIVDKAMQIHGGSGVVRGHILEQLYREVRALRIYEGTTEIQRVVIANVLLGGERARALQAKESAPDRETLRPPEPVVPTAPAVMPRAPLAPVDNGDDDHRGGPDATRKVKALK